MPCHCFRNAVTRIRTEVAAATTQSTNHYTITASYWGLASFACRLNSSLFKAPPPGCDTAGSRPSQTSPLCPCVRRRTVFRLSLSVRTRPRVRYRRFTTAVRGVLGLSYRVSRRKLCCGPELIFLLVRVKRQSHSQPEPVQTARAPGHNGCERKPAPSFGRPAGAGLTSLQAA